MSIELSRKAAENAYCPYSNFHVGAAVICDDGSVVLGCNVENASYGLTNCAERTAIFSAISQGKKVKEIFLSCVDAIDDKELNSKMPCGACRQVMVEHMSPDAMVHIDGVGEFTVSELLPTSFNF
jgi:cytidine deaminase